MFRFDIHGFRCNRETDGIGSDEVGMFVAALPIVPANNPLDFAYTDIAPQEFRIRWADGIDSGDAVPFEYAIGFKQDAANEDDYYYLEVIMMMFEIDGSSSTRSQAIEEHNTFRSRIENRCRPGVRVSDLRSSRLLPNIHSFDSNEAWGAREDLIALDVWYLDLYRDRGLRGSIEFVDNGTSPYYWNPDADMDSRRSRAGITADLYKNPRADGSMSETRSYHSTEEGSRYTFEVIYSGT